MIRSHAQLNSPIRKKRRRFEHNYDRQHLDAVVQKVKDGELTINFAADLYAIPRTTISSRLRKDGWYSKDSIPSDPQLPHQIRAEVLLWIKKMEAIACPSVTKALPFVVQEICEMFGEHTVFPADNLPSEEYGKRLLAELEVAINDSTDLSSKVHVPAIDCWLKKLRSLLEIHYGLDADTFFSGGEANIGQIFCCTQLATLVRRDDGSCGILVNRSSEGVRDRQQLVTMYTCLGADGSTLSPLFIVRSRSSEQKYFVNPTVTEASFEIWSREGVMNGDVLLDWLQLICHEIGDSETNRPLLIFLDESVEHVSLAVLDFCQVNMVILFYLPGQSGVSCRAFGACIFEELFQILSESSGKGKRIISKTSSLNILPELWSHLHSDSVTYEFRRFGLVPLDDDNLKQSFKLSNLSNEAHYEDTAPSLSKENPASFLSIFSVASRKSSALPSDLAELEGRGGQSEKKLSKQTEECPLMASSKSCSKTQKRKISDPSINLPKVKPNIKEKIKVPRQNSKPAAKTCERKRKRSASLVQPPLKPKREKLKTSLVSSSQPGKEISPEELISEDFKLQNRPVSDDNRVPTSTTVSPRKPATCNKAGGAFPTTGIPSGTPATPDYASLANHPNSVKGKVRTSDRLQVLVKRSDESVYTHLCSTIMNASSGPSCGHSVVSVMQHRLEGARVGISQALHLVESSLPKDLLQLYQDRFNRIESEKLTPVRSNVLGFNDSKSSKSDIILSDPGFIIWSKLKQSLTDSSIPLTDETGAAACCVQSVYERACSQECECQVEKNGMNVSSTGALQNNNLPEKKEQGLPSHLQDCIPFPVGATCGFSDSSVKNSGYRNAPRPVCFRKFLVQKIDQSHFSTDKGLDYDSETPAQKDPLSDNAVVDNSEIGCHCGACKQHSHTFRSRHPVKPPFASDSELKPVLPRFSEPLVGAATSNPHEIPSSFKLEPFKSAFGFLQKQSPSSKSPVISHRDTTSSYLKNPHQRMANNAIKLESGTVLFARSACSCGDPHDTYSSQSYVANNRFHVTQMSDNYLHRENLWNDKNTFRGDIVRVASADRYRTHDGSSSFNCQFSDSGMSSMSGDQSLRHSGLSNCCSSCYSLSLSTNGNTEACDGTYVCDPVMPADGSSAIAIAASHQQSLPNYQASALLNHHGEQSVSHANSFLEHSASDPSIPGARFVQEPNLMSLNSLKIASPSSVGPSTVRRLPEASKFTMNTSLMQAELQRKAFLNPQDCQQFHMQDLMVPRFGVNPSNFFPAHPVVSTPIENMLMYGATASEPKNPASSVGLPAPYPIVTAVSRSLASRMCNGRHPTLTSSCSAQTRGFPVTTEGQNNPSSSPHRFMRSDSSFASPSFLQSSRLAVHNPASSFPKGGEISKNSSQNRSTVYSGSENTTIEGLSSAACPTTSGCGGQSSVMRSFHGTENNTAVFQPFPCAFNSLASTSTCKLEPDGLGLPDNEKTVDFRTRRSSPKPDSYSIDNTELEQKGSSNESTLAVVRKVEQSGTPTKIGNAAFDSSESEFNVRSCTPQVKNSADQVTHFHEVTGSSASLPKPPLLAARKPACHDRSDVSEETSSSTRRLLTRSSGRKKLSRILPAVDDSSFSEDECDFVIDEEKCDSPEPARQKVIFDAKNYPEDADRASPPENFIECDDKNSDDEKKGSPTASGEDDSNSSRSHSANIFEHSQTGRSPGVKASTPKHVDWSSSDESNPLSIDNFDSELPTALTLDDISEVFHSTEQLPPHEVDIAAEQHRRLQEFQSATQNDDVEGNELGNTNVTES